MVSPRLIAAYGAFLTAATLGVLYLYRGRSFIVYWIAAWLMLAVALLLVSAQYPDARLAAVIIGIAVLLVTWASGLMFLGVESFPDAALRWTRPVRFMAATAVWFLASPFMAPIALVVASGVVVSGGLALWAALDYLRLAQRHRYAGALLIGGGLVAVCLSNTLGASVMLGVVEEPSLLNRIAVINIVMSIFVSLGMHLLVFEDMTAELRIANRDLAEANDAVRRLAITDPLTGCHNRRFFDEIERREMERHRRYGAPLSVVFIDVNHFKQLNDSLGHEAGDELLRTIGALLRRHVRQSDYVIRWGGDEFLLLLACGDAEAAAKGEELKAAFGKTRTLHDLPAYVAVSVGTASVSASAESLAEAVRDADSAMYRDKVNTTGT